MMKFTIHNLRMIKSRMRSNGWVLGELFLVFIVMWFLCDSLGCMQYTFHQPLGYDINHVYKLETAYGGEVRDTSMTAAAKKLELIQRLERVPGVEAAAGSFWSLPMSGANEWGNCNVTDSIATSVRFVRITKGYMNVFRFGYDDPARTMENMRTGEGVVMLSRWAFDRLKKKDSTFSLDTPLYVGNKDNKSVLHGVVSDFRDYRYGGKAPWAFINVGDKEFIESGNMAEWADITFRVNPEVDSPDFRQEFLDKIAPMVGVDNLFVVDVVPYTVMRDRFESINGDTDRVNTHALIVFFLLANVFLGLIGTFWFRTRRRRSEIALRLSVGSSRKQIFRLLIGEGLLLLTLVAIPAAVVCYSAALGEPTLGNSALISTYPVEWGCVRFLLGIAAAWVLIAAMIVLGIWFPARQAMKIQPAEALREE